MSKKSNYITTNRSKHYLKCHLIFVCKYRKPMLIGQLNDDIKQIFKSIADGSDFEIDPKFIHKSSNKFVVHKSRGVNATPTRASYSVRYKIWNDRYYLSHIRCDLDLKVKKRSRLFSSNFHTFLEMVVIRIENENVVKWKIYI